MFCRIDPVWRRDAAVASRLPEMEIKMAVIVKIVQRQRLQVATNLIRVRQPMRDQLKHSRSFISRAIGDDVELIAPDKDDVIKPVVIDIEHGASPGSRRIELGRFEKPRVSGGPSLWRRSGG